MKARSSVDGLLSNDVVRLALGIACLLLIPLIAMQFTAEVKWTPLDFIAAGSLLFGIGLLYLALTRRAKTARQRLIIGAVLGLMLMYLWAEMAVGVFTNWGS